MFAYFSSSSCDYKTAIQMMGRVRDIASREYHIYIDEIPMNLPQTVRQIKNAIATEAEIADIACNPMNMPRMINANGKYKYKLKDLYYHVHVANIVHRCQSRNRFSGLFLRCRAQMGIALEIVKNSMDVEDTAAIICAVKDIIDEQQSQHIEAIVSADILTHEEANIMQDDETLSLDDKRALAKHKLVEYYAVDPAAVTPEFVDKFSTKKVKTIYQNYRNLARGESITDAVNKMRELRAEPGTAIEDLNSSKSTLMCMFAVDIVNGLLGEGQNYCESVRDFDEVFMCRAVLEAKVDDVICDLRKHADSVSLLFEIRRDALLKPRNSLSK
eukprot:TRINITY_DN764_c0_g2_i3.p1 TRINITY_DN764_c0_g2~~TRINITY_DN764_c0_g2_i3.p1  ORF type:complete len:329 (-),score=42.82 TRINITY_DN764_c0_g2_i3:258-1244(-)